MKALIYVSALVPLIPLSIGLFRFSQLNRDQKILCGIMGLAFIIQVWALIYFENRWNNQFLYHFYTPLEFLGFGLIYQNWLKQWVGKKIFVALILIVILLAILNTLFLQPLEIVNSNIIILCAILLIGLAITFFYFVFTNLSLGRLEKSPEFWINTSVLLYYAGSLLILGLNNYISQASTELKTTVWIFHSSFNILHYLLFSIGLWMKPTL